jgi:hypothetical protein
MRTSRADQRQSPDEPGRRPSRQRHGDVVVRAVSADSYCISTFAGKPLATSSDRLDAMRRACALARQSGGNVWMCRAGSSDTYHEVLCP